MKKRRVIIIPLVAVLLATACFFGWHTFAGRFVRGVPDSAPQRPAQVTLQQHEPREHPEFKFPKESVGPTIPGLRQGQGAIPQGLVFWEKHQWFLIALDFEKRDHPSVVVALDQKGELVRCLTLVEEDGKAHTGHVGGLAVSNEYLWIGSGRLYRAPLKEIEGAERVDELEVQELLEPECTASFVAHHDKRIWVGEFVSQLHGIKADSAHELNDRNGVQKYAWVAGYALDADENLVDSGDGKDPRPNAILSIRQRVQGMAFLGDSIILSISYGRKNDSTLAAYANPLGEERHERVEVEGTMVPLWFLDGQNKQWERDDYPPMSEGITAYGKRFALIFESGADKYQNGGRGSIDTVVFFEPPDGE